MAGPLRGCGNQREPQEGRQRQRGDTRGEGFSINKTAGQILAGLWKHLHPVPEASSELFLAHYWQLVLWAPPGGGGALLALTPLDTHTHTMNQVDNFARACPPCPALCVSGMHVSTWMRCMNARASHEDVTGQNANAYVHPHVNVSLYKGADGICPLEGVCIFARPVGGYVNI